jgi:hypothetical protein
MFMVRDRGFEYYCMRVHRIYLGLSVYCCTVQIELASNKETNKLTPWPEPTSGLVVRVLGYTTEMYCVSCEVRTEFIYVM